MADAEPIGSRTDAARGAHGIAGSGVVKAATVAFGALVALGVAGQAAADGWLEIGAERSGVSIGDDAWWAGRVEAAVLREGHGGASFSVEPLARFGARDVAFGAGGYRHSGPWTVSARAGFTPAADFAPALALEAELARRTVGTWVGHAGYRLLRFPSATVHVFAPALTLYGRRGELHARGFLSRNATAHTSGGALLLQASWRISRRVEVRLGASRGERLFDFAPLSDRAAPGYIAFAGARLRRGAHHTIGIDARLAGEEPGFWQRAVGLTYRRSF